MYNSMSAFTIGDGLMASPIPQIVPLRTVFPFSERIDYWQLAHRVWGAARQVATDRILRLEFLVAVAIVGFGGLAWKTLTWESAVQQVSADRARSIVRLTANISRQDQRISELTQSLQQATRQLTAQVDALSRQLQSQQKEMVVIDSRLHNVEFVASTR